MTSIMGADARLTERLCIIGAPSSAGAYAPGQERAPAALREAGLLDRLHELGVDVHDLGDTESFRWQVDRNNPRAMNAARDECAGCRPHRQKYGKTR